MPDMEDRLNCLEKNINLASDCSEIRNVLNRYLFFFNCGDVNRILSCFALEDPEVSIELGRGKYMKKKELVTFYNRRVEVGHIAGTLVEHGEGSTAVVVAGDRKTARATAISFGYKVLPPADSEAWDIGRYYVEFLRTDTGWKIWHLQWILVAEADTCYGWLTQNIAYQKEEDYPAMDEMAKPEERLHASDCFVDYYKPDEINRFLPEPPQEYESWDGYGVTKNTRTY